jgi:transcriptional regulator with XRE-family HTH domain
MGYLETICPSPMTSVTAPRYQRMLARLREAREAAGLRQAQVAKQLGKPQSYVSKIESGERRIDPLELANLARIYGRKIGWFVDES